MEELYQQIEEKIHAAGYHNSVDGEEIYNEICDEIDGKENGTYLLLAKKEGSVFFEYQVEIMDDSFNLSYLDIHEEDGNIIHIDFDR